MITVLYNMNTNKRVKKDKAMIKDLYIGRKHQHVLNVDTMTEKPKASYAEDFLGVRNQEGEKEYYSVFGQYILTPEVFSQLHEDIMQKEIDGDHVTEIELTSALEAVRQRSGMMGVRLKGRMYDMGNPSALVRAVEAFAK